MTVDKQREGLKANMRPSITARIRLQTHLSKAQQDEIIERLLSDMTEPPVNTAPLTGDALLAFQKAVE